MMNNEMLGLHVLILKVFTSPDVALTERVEFLEIADTKKFLIWVENELKNVDSGLFWALGNYAADEEVKLVTEDLVMRLVYAYRNGKPFETPQVVVTPAAKPADATPKDKPVAAEAKPEAKKKKASKNLLSKMAAVIGWLFRKFMGLSLVGKIVVLVLIFAIISSQLGGGQKNSPPAASTENHPAQTQMAATNPFAEDDATATQMAAASMATAPASSAEKTLEQIKLELIGLQTTINSCSSDGYATARKGPGKNDEEGTPIKNGTSVTIIDAVQSNSYDFKGKTGCGSSLRIKVKTADGQELWVHGSTVEGVAE